jgi:cell fate regulator YaaT (PSP1 superfamily)
MAMSETVNEVETNRKEDKKIEGFDVIGVRFKPSGKIYSFKIGDLDPTPGTWVVVESEMGLSIGVTVRAKHRIEEPEKPLKKVLRVASDKDLDDNIRNRSFAEEARVFCIERVKNRELPMKIVSTETTLDKKRLIFYFTADGRIDFRELVRDLAARFKTRIEMRQIGVRDEVKLIGGIGGCGRETCCSLFLTSFEPVSIRMAKKQELSINQSKLSGICGRLMCCLGYEYEETDKRWDKQGKETVSDEMPAAGKPEKRPSCSCPKKVCAVEEKSPSGAPPRGAAERGSGHGRQKRAQGDRKEEPRAENRQGKGKTKGKPFSKRRKFWKKKKKKDS